MSVTATLTGALEFFSETGTEGGYYYFMDTGPEFAHRYDQPCWDADNASCPTRMTYDAGSGPKYTGKRVSDWHFKYEGLRGLKNGDHLKIYENESGPILWEGTVDLRDVDSWGPDGGTSGLRVHQKANNVDEVEWLEWFLKGLPAELTAKEA